MNSNRSRLSDFDTTLICLIIGLVAGAGAGAFYDKVNMEAIVVVNVFIAPAFIAFVVFGILALSQRPPNRVGLIGLAASNLGICLGMIATYFIW